MLSQQLPSYHKNKQAKAGCHEAAQPNNEEVSFFCHGHEIQQATLIPEIITLQSVRIHF